MNIKHITTRLKQKGCRTTPLRTALLEIMLEGKEPMSVQNLLSALKERNFTPNQTSLYRQLNTLEEHGVVNTVVINPKVQLFEITHDHHHHFVCEGCNEVKDIHSDDIETAFHQFEKQLQEKGLFIQKHELTFFGACETCH